MLLGAHTSAQGGLDKAVLVAEEIGCNTVQIFTKNPNQWRGFELTDEITDVFKKVCRDTGIYPVVAHDSYLINLASPQKITYGRSIGAFHTEMKRAEALGVSFLVTHPGAHKDSGENEGIKRLSESINNVHHKTPGFQLKILLETTAGQGTYLGHRFENLTQMIELIDEDERVGVCFDTCHVFAAGYDIRTREGYYKTLEEFDKIVGFDRLKVIHANDSKKELGSRADRHEHIGEGQIGLEAFRLLLNDERFKGIPMIVETPDSETMHKVNLMRLRDLIEP